MEILVIPFLMILKTCDFTSYYKIVLQAIQGLFG